MFETPEEVKQKEPKGFWIGIAIAAIAMAGGAVFYTVSHGGAQKQASAAAMSAASPKAAADPIRDLKVQRATMNKDRNGTTAVWLVTIENKSADYSYGNIKYETSYVGVDNVAILTNQGTIAATIHPGDQNSSQINDALYPAGTSWYKFKITGATPSAQ
jgi:glycine cleavage system H lipoate-binding protein